MPRKSLGIMTESMLYTIMALQAGPRCGTEISGFIEKLTGGRVLLGPGTLYTILSKFLEAGYIREIATEGRKRTYELTAEGKDAYEKELARMEQCLNDAGKAPYLIMAKGADSNETEQTQNMPAALPAL